MPAYSIISETPIDGYDLFGRGEAIAQANDFLDRLATDAGVRPLMDFFSMDPAEVDSLFGELGLDPSVEAATGDLKGDPDLGLDRDDLPAPVDGLPTFEDAPPEEWFTAEEGLTTVRALISAVAAQPTPDPTQTPDSFDPTPDEILADLGEFVAVLDHLQTAGIRWHLAVDF